MGEFKLAEDESVVRIYRCTAVDKCKVVAGTAIPLRSSKHDVSGMVLVTNKRLIYHMDGASEKGGFIHREVRLSDVTSVSSVVSKFGRDIRMPIVLMVLGFLMIFAPFVYATESGMMDDGADYRDGYNEALEYEYYLGYLDGIIDGEVDNTIPEGYAAPTLNEIRSSEYQRGVVDGGIVGMQRADEDVSAGKAFAVPRDLMLHSETEWITPIALLGMLVFVMSTIVYVISFRTKNWIRLNFGGASGAGVAVKSMSSGEDRNGMSPLTTDDEYYKMVGEIGSMITELRLNGKIAEASA